MEERGNKTIICSVFFLDIVEYSKKSVTGQISLKERFNAFLSTAIRDVPINDRIILDTGDGAAISFLGDVEDALRAALSMRSSLLSDEGLMDPPLLVRMGVNLGPVRLVRDINGQPNIVGDGINVAQRVMGFADPGQILVSRSYYDAASRLSSEYAGMFHYEGARTDKHVREHEVYAIGYPGDLTSTYKNFRRRSRGKYPEVIDNLLVKSEEYWGVLVVWLRELNTYLRETFDHASPKQKSLYIGLAVTLLCLVVLLVVKLASQSEVPINVAKDDSSVAVDANKSDAKLVPQKQEINDFSEGKKAKQVSVAPGEVSLTIKPWGEVYLDGKKQGVSPPLTKLKVSKGRHVIEIRNTVFPVYKRTIRIKSGQKVDIDYKFPN